MKISLAQIKRISGISLEIALGLFLCVMLYSAWKSSGSQASSADSSSTVRVKPATAGLIVGGGTTCTITCPANITTSNDPNQCGAVVNYPAPTTTGTCGTVTCSPASGSFFPVGTTTVNCRSSLCSLVFAISGPNLISFDPAAPATIQTSVAFGGLNMGESVIAIDFRPATGQLYALAKAGTTARVLTVDTTTGATTQVGSTFTANGTGYGFDFNPMVDLIRIVSDAEENFRFNPTTGALTVDPNINPAGDVVGAAYSNNFPGTGSTTLYTIDSGTDSLNTQSPANSGTQMLVGGLGVNTTFVVGFDISGCGVAYAALNEGDQTGFYTINLATGAATLVGDIGGVEGDAVQGIAAVLPANCSFTVTVNDTQPPTITCPANIITTSNATCPPSVSQVANFTTTASDNCPGVVVVCNPPSGSSFPVGTTTVTCTATDATGNTATCSFTVSVFSGCLQDDSNASTQVLFNVLTGQYIFCCGGTIFTGTGTVTQQGCVFTIQHFAPDRKVTIRVDFAVKRGTASIYAPPATLRCTITDRDITNNNCTCGSVF